MDVVAIVIWFLYQVRLEHDMQHGMQLDRSDFGTTTLSVTDQNLHVKTELLHKIVQTHLFILHVNQLAYFLEYRYHSRDS